MLHVMIGVTTQEKLQCGLPSSFRDELIMNADFQMIYTGFGKCIMCHPSQVI